MCCTKDTISSHENKFMCVCVCAQLFSFLFVLVLVADHKSISTSYLLQKNREEMKFMIYDTICVRITVLVVVRDCCCRHTAVVI